MAGPMLQYAFGHCAGKAYHPVTVILPPSPPPELDHLVLSPIKTEGGLARETPMRLERTAASAIAVL